MLDRLLAPAVAALLVATPATPVVAAAKPDAVLPNFAGGWTLNRELSDDAQARMKETMSERRRGGRGPMGGGPMGGGPMGGGPMAGGPTGGPMGGPGMGSTMGAPPDPQEMERMRSAMDDVLRPSESLLVSQDGVAFEIVHEGERVERLYADGRKNKGSSGVERKTRWEADKLVTEAKVGGGFGPMVKITETWTLTEADAAPRSATAPLGAGTNGPGGREEVVAPLATPLARRLTITTRLEGGLFEKPLVLKRLYDRAPAP